ncbi:hypothetical protein AKJ09_06449 [Labilithrix luteola]|uniref:Uncharacterized protein n=1 Tax=Labilithrix luteola TaxID=1391654 RepID=A0A0K1Q1V8_9BACT|nr:hypothetical protein AKJ09_06449 [Labilithrix luteola]
MAQATTSAIKEAANADASGAYRMVAYTSVELEALPVSAPIETRA